jgi:hypothetical protein
MILRRLSEAIAEQNWFIVFIEILVVVVGIFIGLQVDDWNETRKDRKDEQLFLQRLHEDLLLAGELSSRVRDRRLDRLQSVIDAGDVLFDRVDRDTLTEEECISIASSSFFNINASSLSSLEELVGTGRMGIIRDAEIRTALVELQQTRAGLAFMINLQTTSSAFTHLPSTYPDLIQSTSYFDTGITEVRTHFQCDLAGMRVNQSFLNQFSVNADGYDAYVRDGLAPWSSQFDRVHQLVDQVLGMSHGMDSIQ